MSSVVQSLMVFHWDKTTGEYLGSESVTIPAQTGLPAGTTLTSPPEEVEGKTPVYIIGTGSWVMIEDHRNQTVYRVATGEPQTITELGPLPKGVVTTAPENIYQKWDGSFWVDDPDARNAAEIQFATLKKAELMRTAQENITILQDAAELGMATDEEKESLTKWKKYRVLLSRIDVSLAPEIDWP